jgi:predicted TIM-barrel fold metal-dependent hydrolase
MPAVSDSSPPRRSLATVLLCVCLQAPAAVPLFDAHIHYNDDVRQLLPPGRALALLAQAGIGRALASATPGDAVEYLYRQAPERVVPFLRPYPSRAHRYFWHRDPAVPAWVREQLPRIPYRGIGEFHVTGADAGSGVVREIIGIARAGGLALMAHTDPAGIRTILEQAPDTDVIWAHAGFDVPLQEQQLLDEHGRLYLELSFREGMLHAGRLTAAWYSFLVDNASRCLAGSDTYSPGRWAGLVELVSQTRQWLAQLPVKVAAAIAGGNATRLFGEGGA